MAEEKTFTTPQVAAVIGRTVYKTIAYVNRGIATPSIQDADGHGSRRLWSYLDVVRLMLVRRLEDLGLTVPTLRVISPLMTDDRMTKSSVWIIASNDTTVEALAALGDLDVQSIRVSERQSITIYRCSGDSNPPEPRVPFIKVSMNHLHDEISDP